MTLPRMDSRIGLDYIVENREYISKLGAALDTNNVTVKKQVFELLSALCAYNADGYARAIETLEFYKNLKNERYRFKIVINELEKAINIDYQVALLAFINCVIISATNLQDRIRIRNEFIGLKVLPLLNNLRKVAQSVGDIIVQLDVFDEQRECDEAQSLQGPNGINLNSHLDVFYAILRQVADTPQEVPFLSILQHLLRIDSKEPVSDVIWETTEKLVHRATLLENHEDSVRLLRAPSIQKFGCPHCRGDATSPSRKSSTLATTPSNIIVNQQQPNGPMSPVPAPPPPSSSSSHNQAATAATAITSPPHATAPPNINTSSPAINFAPPPPPPPLFIGATSSSAPLPPPIPPGAPPPPPPAPPNQLRIPNGGSIPPRSLTPEPSASSCFPDQILLPQQDTPAPKAKMKTLNWGKIPPNKVIGKQNIWSIVAHNHRGDGAAVEIDWNEMEGLFCLQSNSAQGSPKLGRGGSGGSDGVGSNGYDTLDRKSKKENTEITLLDGKRSLNVNIFLKQFRSSNEDIIQLIRNGEHDDIGAEKLRGLLKILPEVDELDMLKTFNGDKQRLGNAEKFLLQLLEVPNYKLRIESMLLKEEFATNVGYLEPCINTMIYAGDELLNNKMLQEVLYMIVVAGNFLNSGGYAGNAAGVKLTSLQKLTDIRANKPGMNLIHFVALQAAKRSPELLEFTKQINAVENASKTTSEQINNEINTLDGRIRKIKRQIELPTTDEDIKGQMLEFLETAERDVTMLQTGMKEVEIMRLKLAEFFCEDPATFKLEECFKIFHSFCEKFKQAVKENERRQQLEEQATLRRKQREEQLARRAKQLSQSGGTPVSDCENPLLLESSASDPRASPALARRRMGSFNSGIDISSGIIRMESNPTGDTMSPDITPNGSLRRRRSRVLNEDDDLMEFLRNSAGQEHNSRERKSSSYGSLDRSWARRARSGSANRKRPDLLNIDFGVDRERATSPSPMMINERQSPSANTTSSSNLLTTTTTITPDQTNEDVKPRISREWRQKIESWLQSNENDEKQNEEYKRKRRLVTNSRRSLENDAESERKLDTLPEERIAPTALNTNITPTTTTTTTTITQITTNSNENNNNNNGKINSPNESYQRVYPDWKPSKTLQNTDIVGTIQAISDVSNAARKHSNIAQNRNFPSHQESSQNVSTQSRPENTIVECLRHSKRNRSLENNTNSGSGSGSTNNPSPLQSIAEEDRRKSYIQQLGEREAMDRSDNHMKGSLDKGKENAENPILVTSYKSDTNTKHQNHISENLSNEDVDQKSSGTTTKSAGCSTNTPISISIRNEPQINDISKLNLNRMSGNHQDIDADNIETPPVTRRTRTGSTVVTICNTNSSVSKDLEENIADSELPGHFDRYSSTRRTRRYKRPTDYSSGNEELTPSASAQDTPNTKSNQKTRPKPTEQPKPTATTKAIPSHSVPDRTTAKLEKVGRHISSINQEDVREAIRNLKSPTGTSERVWSPTRDHLIDSEDQQRPLKAALTDVGNVATKSKDVPTNIKVSIPNSHHELNDEGFEETQSLVSDTPSHGKEESTNSSGNEKPEKSQQKQTHSVKAGARRTQTNQIHSKSSTTGGTVRTDRVPVPTKARVGSSKPMPPPSNGTPRRAPSAAPTSISTSQLDRTRLLRTSNGLGSNPNINNAIKRNSNVISTNQQQRKQPEINQSNQQHRHHHPTNQAKKSSTVERTSSRNSLRSSRSSITSGTSIQTVRRMPPPLTAAITKTLPPPPPLQQTVSVDSSPSKRPLTAQNSASAHPRAIPPSVAGYRAVPASRSSSSGSSIGHNIVVVRKSTATKRSDGAAAATTNSTNISGSTSFKENQQQIPNSAAASRANAARGAVLVKAVMSQNILNTVEGAGGAGGGGLRGVGGGSSATGSTNGKTIVMQTAQRPSSRASNTNARLTGFMRPTASSATKRSK